MRRVMIGTPAYTGAVDVRYADSLVASMKLCALSDMELFPVYWPGEALVQRARDALFQLAVEAPVDDLVFIDSDQGWDAPDLLKLLRHPVDVVGAAVRKKSDDEQYNVVMRSEVIDQATGLLIVESIGTGFLRLSRRALDAMWASCPAYTDKRQPCRSVFPVGIDPVTKELVGEDTALCRAYGSLGFRVHLDPSITVRHVGTKVYEGDFAAFLKRVQSERAA